MAATNYVALTAAMVAAIRDAPGVLAEADAGRPVHVIDDMIPPTMEQCPAVLVLPQAAQRTLRRLGVASSAPSDETVSYVVTCWAFSAESGADSGRQRSELLTLVLDALERDRTLGGVVCGLTAPSVTFRPVQLDVGLFATAEIRVDLLVKA